MGPIGVGAGEGRCSPKPRPNLPIEVLVDQLAACALHTGQTPAQIEELLYREAFHAPLWSPATPAPKP